MLFADGVNSKPPSASVTPINTPTWTLERNPYSVFVDTAGNQLPYIDRVVLTLAENLEVVNLRAIAGEYDFQQRHLDLGKLPVFLENQARGGYKVYLDPGDYGGDMIIKFNLSYEADPEIEETIKRTIQPYFVLQGNVAAFLAAKDHVNVFLYDPIAPDPEGIITAGHDNKTGRMISYRHGDAINEPALLALFREIIANNRAGGWRRLRGR